MNEMSRGLALPIDHPLHAELRGELCDDGLLGGDGATRYFVSVLAERDVLGVRDPAYPTIAKPLAARAIGNAVDRWLFNEACLGSCSPLFERQFRDRFGDERLQRRWSKEDEAIVCRLASPDASDAQIAERVPTTIKQLNRFGGYKYLLRFRA